MKQKTVAIILAMVILIWIAIPRHKPNPFPVNSIIDYEKGINVHYPVTGNNNLDKKIEIFINQTIDEYTKKNLTNSFLYIHFSCYSSLFTMFRFKITIQKDPALRNFFKTSSSYKNFLALNSTKNTNIKAVANPPVETPPITPPNPNKKLIALTFDDGPNSTTKEIVDILDKYDAKGTFLILGTQIEDNKQVLIDTYNSGHEIGNHTFGHKILTSLSQKQMEEEINKTQELIKSVIGIYPTFLRPPYGAFNTKVRENCNLPILLWNKDTMDWKNREAEYIFNKSIENLEDGDILLFHDIYPSTAKAIEKLIPYLIENGYQPVTTTQLLESKGITPQDGVVYYSASKNT